MTHDRWDTRPWIQRLGDATSQFFNVLLLNGMTDESISGRTWRGVNRNKRSWKTLHPVIEALFWFIDRGEHCRLAYEQDIERSSKRASAIKLLKERDGIPSPDLMG